MFNIYADGRSIREPLDEELQIFSPRLTLEMGKAGSLTFQVPPNHKYYNDFNQLKTIVTVELDGEEIFRGRVLKNARNFMNVRTITCEGILAYLVDTVQKARKFEGKTHELFSKIVARHNNRVKDNEKKFTVGQVTIENRSIKIPGKSNNKEEQNGKQIILDAIVDEWDTTYSYIEKCLIDYCGGYLRTRRVGSTNYLDLVVDYGKTAVQEIEFGTNLIDLNEEISAEDVFTVLIPLGEKNLTIAEVNNDSDELVDEEGVKLFGRIVQTKKFESVNKAETLLSNAKKYMKLHENMPLSITVKALDMHLVDGNIPNIDVGDKVRINSLPHDLVDTLTCTKIEYELDNPANNAYTFGKPKQSLTAIYKKDKQSSGGGGAAGAGGGAAQEDAEEKLEDFYNAWIDFKPGDGTVTLGALFEKYKDVLKDVKTRTGMDFSASPTQANFDIYANFERYDENENLLNATRTDITGIAKELYAAIDLLATVEKNGEDTANTLANLKLEATDKYAKIDSHTETLMTYGQRITTAETNITQLTNDHEAMIQLVANFQVEVGDAFSETNASLTSIASDVEAFNELLAEYKNHTDNYETQSSAKLTQLSNNYQAMNKLTASFQKELFDDKGKSRITKAESGLEQATSDYTSINNSFSKFKKATEDSISSSESKINQINSALSSQIELEAKHYEEIMGDDPKKGSVKQTVASIKLLAEDNGSKITAQADEIELRAKTVTVNGQLDVLKGEFKEIVAGEVSAQLMKGYNMLAGTLTASTKVATADLTVSGSASFTGKTATAFNINPKVNGKPIATQEWVTGKKYLTQNNADKRYILDEGNETKVSSLKATNALYTKNLYVTGTAYDSGKALATIEWVTNNFVKKT